MASGADDAPACRPRLRGSDDRAEHRDEHMHRLRPAFQGDGKFPVPLEGFQPFVKDCWSRASAPMPRPPVSGRR